MKYRIYPSLMLLLMMSIFSAEALATHETNEKHDGSINSFRWLKSPLMVKQAEFRNAQDEQIKLSQFNGKFVLLNLWATWCPPCIKELPALDSVQQRLGGDDFVIVAVSMDDDIKQAKEMFDSLSIQSIALHIESVEKLGRNFPVDVVPASFLIDREGQAIGVLRSYVDWDNAETDALINRLIAGVSTATLRAEKLQ